MGSLAAQEKLEHVSMAKSEVDKAKGETLDDISSMVERITATIASKKTALAPLIKELRQLRSDCQVLQVCWAAQRGAAAAADVESVMRAACPRPSHAPTFPAPHQQAEYNQHKSAYDSKLSMLELNKSKEEKEVSAYREEAAVEESRYHYLQTMMKHVTAQVSARSDCG